MTSLLNSSARWLRGARRAFVLTALSLAAACAPAGTMHRDLATHVGDAGAKEADRVLWVRAAGPDRDARIVLTGADVRLLAGQRAQHGDTLYAIAPFAVALPDTAFELQIETVPATTGRGARRGSLARVEYDTRDEFGEISSVRAEGTSLLLARPAAGRPLALIGAQHRFVRSGR